ncbi:SCO2521 family protein [Streptomyces finlayi]|uniref:SCO2521 family protein n=1 Tax=Streptomyces finlayi TaxID=67296 RepID=UPI001E5C26A1|nr:SCO2521 family protein [Streptomyces finlayi]
MSGNKDAGHETVVVCGEVRTALLQTSLPLSQDQCARFLALRPDEPVRVSERPNVYAVSPDLLTGVDCRLPAASGSRVRGVGTVRAHAALTGGRVIQASAHFQYTTSVSGQRLPWSHYLVRPGLVERLGRTTADDLTAGFLAPRATEPGLLDPGSIASRLLDRARGHELLDGQPPLKSRRTRLRWAVRQVPPGAEPSVHFTIVDTERRTLLLLLPGLMDAKAVASVPPFCEELALHDWLLTTLIRVVERRALGSLSGPEVANRLGPAVSHLLHLWLPGARSGRELPELWNGVEQQPGFTRQWQTLVQRIRDQLALQSLPLHDSAPESSRAPTSAPRR